MSTTRPAPSPLLSIGLDARGLPVSIFTLNHWVAGGYWFDAATSMARDRRLARMGPAATALADRRVEVLSSARLDWATDLSGLESKNAS